MIAYIFGYGSLLHPEDWVTKEMPAQPIYGLLDDHQRHFEVAIDNLSPQYRQKHYREHGKRAPYFIGTLGLDRMPKSQTNGLAIPVDQKLFSRIKIRERSYILSDDLRDHFSQPLEKPLFTFYPKESNRQLYLQGKREGKLFLPKRYLDYCLEGFAAYKGQDDFLRLTKKADYPLRDLQFYRQAGAL